MKHLCGHERDARASGGIIQLNIRYWVKTASTTENSECRSKIIAAVLNKLKENGFVLK